MLECIKFQPMIIFGHGKKDRMLLDELYSKRIDAIHAAKNVIKTLKEENTFVKYRAGTIKFK